MNKFIAIGAAVLALVAMPQVSHAQSTKATSKNNTVSGAAAEAASVGAIFMPGAIGGAGAAGAAAASASSNGGFNQPQLVMNTAGAPSTGTFNDCGIAMSGGLWVLTFSYTGESKSCVAQRQALLANSMGMQPMAFERMCDVPEWKAAAERTAGPQCAASVEERRVADAKRPQPVAAAPAPVVAANAWCVAPNSLHTMPNGSQSCY